MNEKANELRVLRSNLESQEQRHWESGEYAMAEQVALQVFQTSLEIKRIMYNATLEERWPKSERSGE